MQFSVLFALALSVIGVMAAPVEQRNVECRGILNGDILSGNGNPSFEGNGSPTISGNGNGNGNPSNFLNGNGNDNGNGSANPKDSGNGNDAGTANDNNPIGALGSILGVGKNN